MDPIIDTFFLFFTHPLLSCLSPFILFTITFSTCILSSLVKFWLLAFLKIKFLDDILIKLTNESQKKKRAKQFSWPLQFIQAAMDLNRSIISAFYSTLLDILINQQFFKVYWSRINSLYEMSTKFLGGMFSTTFFFQEIIYKLMGGLVYAFSKVSNVDLIRFKWFCWKY